MSEFLSVEDAAQRLGVAENQVRQWIRRGIARASRRGGDYQLRVAEVQRLMDDGLPQSAPLDSKEPLPESPEPARKPKVLPPRTKEGWAGERDRRRRQGRRAADFTLEMLNDEIQKAVATALQPLIQTLPAAALEPSTPTAVDLQAHLEQSLARITELEQQLQQLPASDSWEDRILALEAELRGERGLNTERTEELETLRRRLVELEQAPPAEVAPSAELQQETAQARQRVGELERAWEESHLRTAELEQQAQHARSRAAELEANQETLENQVKQLQQQLFHLERARENYRQRLEDSEQQRLQLSQQHHGTEQRLQQLEDKLEQERQERDYVFQQLENARQEIERLRQDSTESNDMSVEAERARWSLESRSLQGEIDRLNAVQERFEEQRRELENQLQMEREAHQQTHQRLEMIDRANHDVGRRFEEKESQLENENRKLREQLNSLNYRLQMAGPGTAGPSPEESRKLMDRIAEAEAQMSEKDGLINQNYAEIGDLRSKLDAVQRQHYELQQQYERIRDEWSQMKAKEMTEHQLHQQQQHVPPPGPAQPPPDRKSTWGGLFRPRGE